MSYETIKYDRSGGIATVTFNRPDKLNALNDTMQDELMAIFEEVARDDSVRVLVFTGEGRAFSAGADIGQRFLEPIEKSKKGEVNLALMHTFTRVGVAALKRIEKPILAMINGAAVLHPDDQERDLPGDRCRSGIPGVVGTPGFQHGPSDRRSSRGGERVPRKEGPAV